jgi:Uma2 family endonuclease
MSTYATVNLNAVEHLPGGAMLRLEDVSWGEYEQLLEELVEWPGVRVSYDQGRVEIMSPTPEHEDYKDLVYSMVRVMSEESQICVETRGSTTYKRASLLKGAEPDASIYVANAEAIIGKRRIDLSVDPPPDIVVEIDITSESLGKFPIYAALAVPEIWRYDGKRARFYHFEGHVYAEAPSNRSFPFLPALAMTEFIEQSKAEGQYVALAAFRKWVRAAMQVPSSD